MKLDRLASTTESLGQEAREQARTPLADVRVAACEPIDGDRQRSVQQEIASLEAAALASDAGRQRQQQRAHRLAGRLLIVGSAGGRALWRLGALATSAQRLLHLDTSA